MQEHRDENLGSESASAANATDDIRSNMEEMIAVMRHLEVDESPPRLPFRAAWTPEEKRQ
ncbi:MAG TPA: hypothetical protein VGR16_07825 [Thermomicrobiales bacterium]|nr:hypothetical protein [Thermomicrobiales bacterium]